MDLPSHAKIENGTLWIRGFRGTWRAVLEQEPNESNEDLFDRWLEIQSKKMTDQYKHVEDDRIARILSWLIPILILALGVWVASLIPD